MSFSYSSYTTSLKEITKSPKTWLGKENDKFEIIKALAAAHDKLYYGLPADQRKVCDGRFTACSGPLKISSMNDGNKLLLAVFGPIMYISYEQKMDKLSNEIKAVE